MPKENKPKGVTGRVLLGGIRDVSVGSVQRQAQNIPASGGAGGSSGAIPTGNTDDGTLNPWHPGEPISDADRHKCISNWVGSSKSIRHAVQGRPEQYTSITVKQAQQFDDWLNDGSYSNTIYRGKGVSAAEHQAILGMKPGDMYSQNGPASFSSKESVAQHFADGGYSPHSHNQRVVFVLEQGTNCGRNIHHKGGLGSEYEVVVGSASKLVLTKPPETKVIHGTHYTYVYGVEMKTQYTPSHANRP